MTHENIPKCRYQGLSNNLLTGGSVFIRCSVVSQFFVGFSSLSPESAEPDSIDFGESERLPSSSRGSSFLRKPPFDWLKLEFQENDETSMSFSTKVPKPRCTKAAVKLKRLSFILSEANSDGVG